MVLFKDRTDAGRNLASRLADYGADALVLALPRGGVPVAFEVARVLGASLDVFLVRKLGVPGREELAMGAVASSGGRVMNDEVTQALHIPEQDIAAAVERETRELERRERLYRGDKPFPAVEGRTVILVDDGLATGASMRAVVAALRQQKPGKLVVAVPTAPLDTCEVLRREVNEVVCATTPEPFYGVGQWYESFPQTRDEEVRELLERAAQELAQGETV